MLLVKGFDKWGSRRNAYKRCYQGKVADRLCRMCCLLSVLFPWASQVALVVKNPPASAGDIRDSGSIPGLGGSPGRGPGKTLQYSCLENPLDRGAWWATVHRVSKSRTGLKRLSTHTRAISPLDCEHIKDNSHWLLCLYSPKVCAGHTVGFQQVFVDLLKIKGGLNVRKEKKKKNQKKIGFSEESYSLSTEEMVTAELFPSRKCSALIDQVFVTLRWKWEKLGLV